MSSFENHSTLSSFYVVGRAKKPTTYIHPYNMAMVYSKYFIHYLFVVDFFGAPWTLDWSEPALFFQVLLRLALQK